MKIMNSFYKDKNIHTHTWSAGNSKTLIGSFIANGELSEPFLDVRVYRGSDVGSDHFLTLAKLRFPPKYLHLPRTQHAKKIYFIVKSDYAITKVGLYDGYTSKEFNRNYKKFQKAATLFFNGGTRKP
jgi:hypothetical protein